MRNEQLGCDVPEAGSGPRPINRADSAGETPDDGEVDVAGCMDAVALARLAKGKASPRVRVGEILGGGRGPIHGRTRDLDVAGALTR